MPKNLIDVKGADEGVGPVASRRGFLAWGLWAVAGILGTAAAWPLYELGSRRLKEKKLVFYDALPLDDLPEVGIKKVELTLRGGTRPDTRIFIKQDAAGNLTAFSAVCSHLGCLVNFDIFKQEFICPCHGGRYNTDGRPIAGPPPAPLARLPVKVEGGKVQIGFNV